MRFINLLDDAYDWDYQGLGFPEDKYYIQPLLGRYDMLMVGNIRLLCRCPLPWFRSEEFRQTDPPNRNTISDELFPTFFSRREMAFPVSLSKKEPAPRFGRFSTTSPVAFLAISLQRRNYRLDFLARLLRILDSNSASSGQCDSSFLEQVGSQLESLSPYAYLTDGWGDLVLVFHRKDNKPLEALEAVFEVQNAVYQDFMVDRTELIFATPVFYKLMSEKGDGRGEKFQVEIDVRLMEDRLLEPSNDEFITNAKKWIGPLKKKLHGLKEVRIFKQPGNMDFAIRFEFAPGSDQGAATGSGKLLEELKQEFLHGLSEDRFLDRIDTNIQYTADFQDDI